MKHWPGGLGHRNLLKRLNPYLFILLSISIVGCMDPYFRTGPLQRDQVTLTSDLAEVEALNLEIVTDGCVNVLDLTGSTEELLAATFLYNVPDWKPEFKLTESRSEVSASFRAPSCSGFLEDEPQVGWQLHFNELVPLNLALDFEQNYYAVGIPVLDLRGLLLNDLQLTLRESEAYVVDLSGPWPQGFEARILATDGVATLIVPNSVGVAVIADKIDSNQIDAPTLSRSGENYINALHATADVVIDILLTSESGRFVVQEAAP